jgi:hypothetical protein
MSVELRQRLLIIFRSGSAEELATVLQLLLLPSTRNSNEPALGISLPEPAHEDKCKLSHPHYLIAKRSRN